jgi:hypothetical protein
MRDEIQMVVYRFNGDPRTDERIKKTVSRIGLPRTGDMIVRNGKKWKVSITRQDYIFLERAAIPVYRIFLTDTF